MTNMIRRGVMGLKTRVPHDSAGARHPKGRRAAALLHRRPSADLNCGGGL